MLTAKVWIDNLNRLQLGDKSITITGGEPTLHPEFYEIVNGVSQPIDLLTNGAYRTQGFMSRVKPGVFVNDRPYASIRFSYHPGYTDLYRLVKKVSILQDKGYSVGVWAVNHPADANDIVFAKTVAENYQIDFRLKDFLGYYKEKLYGRYMYPEMLEHKRKAVECKPSELLVGPDGAMYRCHQHLYSGTNSYANIQDEKIVVPSDYRTCNTTEPCSYCDLKGPKFDRFQQGGHCSVAIRKEEQ